MNLGKLEEPSSAQIRAIGKMSRYLGIQGQVPKSKTEASLLIDSLIKRVTKEIRLIKADRISNEPLSSIFWENHDMGLDWTDPQF
jgi:hypothetical protein